MHMLKEMFAGFKRNNSLRCAKYISSSKDDDQSDQSYSDLNTDTDLEYQPV